MSKVKILIVSLMIVNSAVLIYLVRDSALLQEQLDEIGNIRVQLPEEFKKEVADKITISSEKMSTVLLERASNVLLTARVD